MDNDELLEITAPIIRLVEQVINDHSTPAALAVLGCITQAVFTQISEPARTRLLDAWITRLNARVSDPPH